MLMALGPVEFQIAPFNMHELSRQSQTDYAWHDVVGAEPVPEWVGEGVNAWRIEGRLFPERIGGLGDLQMLHQARASGEPQYCMRGDGRPLGWVVIERMSERESFLDAQGAGRLIEFDVDLRRAAGPSNADFFSIIGGLLG